MQIALILAESRNTSENDQFASAARRQSLEIAHALAIAKKLAVEPDCAIVAIGRENSTFAEKIRTLDIPFMGARGIFKLFALWRWQRKIPDMHILCVGSAGVPLAARLAAMRKKRPTTASLAFLLAPAALNAKNMRFAQNTLCICGSAFIEANLREEFAKSGHGAPQTVISAPGMELEGFVESGHEYVGGGNAPHFVFGMAESLLPESGALLLIRAMSALWQKEDLPPWEARMYGSGPRFAEVLGEAANLGVSPRLAILSDQPLDEASRHCHAWIAPGRSGNEEPATLWSGAAAGLPTICSQSPLHKERMGDSQAALRINGDNPQELARAIIGLMKDSRLRARLAAASRALRPKIGLEAMAERVARIIRNGAPS